MPPMAAVDAVDTYVSGLHDIWVHADLPAPGVDERAVDRLLGLIAEAAVMVREHAAASARSDLRAGRGPSAANLVPRGRWRRSARPREGAPAPAH
jgi:hypothetical protein